MCLITSEKNGWVAREPKVCYKVYERDGDTYVSPIVGARYKLNPGDEVVAEETLTLRSYAYGYWAINGGAIHAFKDCLSALVAGLINTGRSHHLVQRLSFSIDRRDWAQAEKDLEDIKQYISKQFVVCLMEIPAGEEFWMGTEDICSRRMIFRGEVDLSWELLIHALTLCCPDYSYAQQIKCLVSYKEKSKEE